MSEEEPYDRGGALPKPTVMVWEPAGTCPDGHPLRRERGGSEPPAHFLTPEEVDAHDWSKLVCVFRNRVTART